MLIAITARIATEMTAISGSPRRAKPIAAPTTRLSGVAMTTSNPSHRKPAGSSPRRSGMICDGVERWADGQWRDAGQEHQDHADREQHDGDVGDDDQQPAEAPFERLAGRWGSAHPRAFRNIWRAVHSRTATNSMFRKRSSIRCATREPTLAPMKTPIATVPAMYGSISPLNR